jgi:PAS domain S-box-containing protein
MSTSEARRETGLIDSVLDALLQRETPPQVVAISATGFFVPMPPTVPAMESCMFEGRTSALQLVISSELHVIVETWERAQREGVASSSVHLLADPRVEVELYFVDARHRYGVLLGFILVPCLPSDTSSPGKTAIPPRVWNLKKDQFAVIIDVDVVVSEILGWSPAEMIGCRSTDFVHPEDAPRATANWMDLLAAPGVSRRARVRYRHRDGSWIWFELTNHNRLDDPAYGFVQSEMVNISDEIAAIEALRFSQELRRLTEALPLGVIQIDPAGSVTYGNERLLTILGKALAATIEEQFSEVVPADREALAIALHGLREGRDSDLEVALYREGEARRCSLSLRALRSERDSPAGAIVCISDITESARMREELQIRATYDALTGCHNRASVLTVLDRAIRASSAPGSGTAVLFGRPGPFQTNQ